MPPLSLFILLAAVLSAADNPRIARVEAGLRPGIQVGGEAPTRWSLRERMAHHKVPAVSIAVVDGNRIVWAKAYGVLEAGRAAEAKPGTLFQAASISKPIGAMGVLRLVAAGKLALDEDVNLKLKSWKVPASSFEKPVTLRMLLSHSAGLTVHGFPGYAPGATVPSLPQLLSGTPPANTAAVRVDKAPGSEWRYSGGGYEVMQQLVEDVTGTAWAPLMSRLILRPLGMEASTYEQPLPEKLAGLAAAGHRGDGSVVKGRWHTYPEQAAAGLWTTPTDLARALLAVQAAYRGDTRLLPVALSKEMLTVQKGQTGLGWGVRGEGPNLVFDHGGANEGYRCVAFAYAARGQGAVVMTNGDRGSMLGTEILRSVAAEYGWPDFQVQAKTIYSMSSEKLQRYLGKYTSPMGEVEVTATAKGLTVQTPRGPVDFLPESESTFFPTQDGVPMLTFESSADGKVTGLKVGNVVGKRVAP